MKKLIIALALLLNLSACGYDPVREAVNYQLDGVFIGEAMLNYKAMGKINVKNHEEKGTVSVVGTIDNKSYTAEFPTSQVAQILTNPNNRMQVVFYLSKHISEQQKETLKLDHCAIILKENGEERRTAKYDIPEDKQCTKLLLELNSNGSLI